MSSALLAGCASFSGFGTRTPTETPTAQDLIEPVQAKSEMRDAPDASRAVSAAAAAQLPSVELSEELLYKLLTSEIAFQRGNWQSAYVTLLAAAQQTRDPRLAKRAAEMALSAKQPAESLAAIRLWRELAPESSEAAQYYLGFMVINNNFDEIEKIFSDKLASAAQPEYGMLMLQAQRLLARSRDKKIAFDTLEKILEPYKLTLEAHLALAQGAYTSGDNARARREAKAALKLKPDSQLAILTVAQASTKPEAIQEISAFIKKNPDASDVRLAYASMLIELKQLDLARAEFEQLLRDKPGDIGSMYALGALAMDSGQFKLAEKYFLSFLTTLEAHPEEERDPTATLINLAQIALERQDTAAAMDWLAKVESYDGKNAVWMSVQVRRAQLMAKNGKLDQARQFLNDLAPESEADQIQVLQAESQLLRNAGQEDEAMRLLDTAIERFPDNTNLLYDYAMLAESQKKLDVMETQLRRVIQLAPASQHAYNALGYSFADRNIHLDEAASLIEKALELAPEDPFILDSLGWVKFRMAKYEEAEQILRRAYQLRPDAEIAIHLGEVLWTAGKKDSARQLWREAKIKDPGNEVLKSTLLRLNVKP